VVFTVALLKKLVENVFGADGDDVLDEPIIIVGVCLCEYCSRIAFISILRTPCINHSKPLVPEFSEIPKLNGLETGACKYQL
jgi:hypothetical protein